MNDFILTLMLLGAMSSGDNLPFWATANRFGIMPEGNGGLLWVGASTSYDQSKTVQWRWGASLAAGMDDYPDDFSGKLMVDELYGSLKWNVFSLDLGIKHNEQGFLPAAASLGSLSSTAGHLIWSGNSRSIPGYSLNIDPWTVPYTGGRLTFSASYGDYRTLDDRYVEGAMVHHSKATLDYRITEKLSIFGSLDHYALWRGDHPVYGKRPSGLKNYLKVVTGSSGGDDSSESDQINVLGDQRGSEIFGLLWKGDSWNLAFQHDIPYDDRSGMYFKNFPDGVNTLHLSLADKDALVSDVLFEYATTTWQSGRRHDRILPDGKKKTVGGGDNYFNNGEYRSGWTYYGRTIGYPLFFPAGTRDGSWDPGETVLGVENNRLKAVHFGLSGKLFKYSPYKLMLTYSRNFGLYIRPYEGESSWEKDPGTYNETSVKQFSGAFIGEVPLSRFSLIYGLYADSGSVLSDTFGATLGLRWSFSPSRL